MLIIDRFDGDWAVVEFENGTFNFPRKLLPEGIKEGDIINFVVAVDEQATAKRARDIEKLAVELFKD